MIDLIELDVCDSTQEEVRQRLLGAAPQAAVAVRATAQRAGAGRAGRAWQNPPGEALLLSVGLTGPLPIEVLDGLARRAMHALQDVLSLHAPAVREQLQWRAPNDLVATADGAKVAGILIDARTRGDEVEQLIVGIGCNLRGPDFVTDDGRAATSVEHAAGWSGASSELARTLADTLLERISTSSPSRS